MTMQQNTHACRPPGPLASELVDIFFSHRVVKILSEEQQLSKKELEVLGRALERVNTIFQGMRLVQGLSSVYRGHEPLYQYKRALKVLEERKFKIDSKEKLTATLAKVHDEIENAIKMRKTDPKASKTAILFFEGVETCASNGGFVDSQF